MDLSIPVIMIYNSFEHFSLIEFEKMMKQLQIIPIKENNYLPSLLIMIVPTITIKTPIIFFTETCS